VRGAVVAQVMAGIVNLLLLAPIAMQIVHLVLADALWIALVVLAFEAFEQPEAARDPDVDALAA
jgi:heme A synthase